MILLPLLACVVLGALSAQAEVVKTFAECNKFFYNGKEPAGMDQDAKKICQTLKGKIHYFTLYSTHHRIPVYSAYTFKIEKKGTSESGEKVTSESGEKVTSASGKKGTSASGKKGTSESEPTWLIEPQISVEDSDVEMKPESDFVKNSMNKFQAINSDYNKTGYDRGHLMPKSYRSGDDREATFTLTNAAPMHPCFNRVYWSKWESGVLELLIKNTESTVYLVTGTVPHPKDQRKEPSDEYKRVNVPTHIWTAVCYEDTDNKKNFSFGYIGLNVADTTITMMPVDNLNSELAKLYRESGIKQAENLRIFDECYCNQEKYEEIIKYLKDKVQPTSFEHINNFVQMSAKSTCSETSDSKKRVYSSLTDFSQDLEIMKQNKRFRACVLTDVDTSRISDLRKGDPYQGSDAVKCQQVTEKSDPTAMTAADGTRCQDLMRFCKTEDGFKPCCSTPCLYQETHKGYWCRSGQTEIQCSPQYSSITVKGEKCRDDHQCGTYGKDYYWCKTSSSWNYCSPPLWKSKTIDQKYCRSNHACAKYGKTYTWCKTDSDNNWNYCCNHDDCYSAINGKTCRSDHKCGYHGEDYLWCRTTDGSWEKCCTRCQ